VRYVDELLLKKTPPPRSRKKETIASEYFAWAVISKIEESIIV
jgi:hypothetical protein